MVLQTVHPTSLCHPVNTGSSMRLCCTAEPGDPARPQDSSEWFVIAKYNSIDYIRTPKIRVASYFVNGHFVMVSL